MQNIEETRCFHDFMIDLTLKLTTKLSPAWLMSQSNSWIPRVYSVTVGHKCAPACDWVEWNQDSALFVVA